MKDGSSGNGNWSSLVVGAVVGAAVGVGAALLFAPRTGKETRKWLASNTRDLRDRATAALDEVRESVQRETKGIVGQAVKDIASVQTVNR
jgi:gas vesicle protein